MGKLVIASLCNEFTTYNFGEFACYNIAIFVQHKAQQQILGCNKYLHQHKSFINGIRYKNQTEFYAKRFINQMIPSKNDSKSGFLQ